MGTSKNLTFEVLSFPRAIGGNPVTPACHAFFRTGSPTESLGDDRPKKWVRGALIIFFSCLASFCLCSIADARDYSGFGPISIRSQNPVYLQNLSLTPGRAETLPEGTLETRIDTSYSSMFEREANASADLNLDMELLRIAPTVTYGLTHNFEVGLEVPLVHFSGGFLDGFVQKFHRFFGFPNGGRELVGDNVFSYQFSAIGAPGFNFNPNGMGLGDITFHIKQQLTGEDMDIPAIAWFADFKFPTGSESRGMGSGAPDFGIGAAVETSYKRLHGYLNVEYLAIGGSDLIDGYMHNEMFAYMIAGELVILPELSLIVQIDGSAPLLTKTNFDEWDGLPMDFVVGFRGGVKKIVGGPDFFWQIAFSEDVTSKGPSVDFTAFVSLGLKFDLAGRSRPAGDWLAKKSNSKF